MIWTSLFFSFGLVSARENVEPEFLDELMATGQYEKFAELLGIQKHLVRPNNTEERSEGSILNQASSLGDVILTEEQANSSYSSISYHPIHNSANSSNERNAIDFNYYTTSRWTNGIVPYVLSSSYSADNRKIILNAIKDFNSKVKNVKLVPRRRHKDYVYLHNGNGCYSFFGRVGGQQVISLQDNGCVNTATVQHEFIHAIGIAHEHNRLDRDNHIQILWNNIPSNWQSQYYKVNEQGWKDIGNYDYYSIMHYPIWSPETYKDAFALPGNIDRNRLGKGKDDAVTDGDVYKLNTLYA